MEEIPWNLPRKRLKTRAWNLARKILSLDELRPLREKKSSVQGIYFLFLGDQLMYVGQSINVYARIAAHDLFEWDSFCYIKCESFTREEMELVETAYIAAYKPPGNRQLNRVKQKKIEASQARALAIASSGGQAI